MTVAAAIARHDGIDRRAELDPASADEAKRFFLELRVKHELGEIARYYPRFYGRAFDPERTSDDVPIDEARDYAAQRRWRRACEYHRRFESLPVGPGRQHYRVLHLAYVVLDGKFELYELGRTLASPAQCHVWKRARDSVRKGAYAKFAQRLLREAIDAYGRLIDGAV